MIESEREVLQAIKNLVSDIGYDFHYKGDESSKKTPWVVQKKLHAWLVQQSREDDSVLMLDIVIIPKNRFEVSFLEGNKKNRNRKICNDQDEMLDFIKNYLRTREFE